MGANVQQQAFVRKLVYLGVILMLFAGTLCYRFFFLQARAEALAMRETTRGDVELGGSAMRLVLTGSRGLVICALSWELQQAHEKHQWNREELMTRYLTKLQPHYIEPWIYHSWNLAYNVSVEKDRVRDRYYFMTRGIGLIAEGERQNRNNPDLRWHIATYYQDKIGRHDERDKLVCLFQMSCMEPLERDPARFFSYEWNDLAANKAKSDDVPGPVVEALTKLKGQKFPRQDQFLQEIEHLWSGQEGKEHGLTGKDIGKYSAKVAQEARVLKPAKFIAFCKRYPQFVRRLRERCTDHDEKRKHESPEAVIRFLEENQKIPCLFSLDRNAIENNMQERDEDEIPAGKSKMLDVDDFDRFPALPLPPNKRSIPEPQSFFPDDLNSDNEDLIRNGGDTLDAFTAARTWYAYAQEPLPEPDPRKPGWSKPVENRLTQRMPKRLRSILFRSCPARAQHFVAERLQREGWFDRWDLAEAFRSPDSAKYFPPRNADHYKIGNAGVGKEAWQQAYSMWQNFGHENFLLTSEEDLKAKRRLANEYFKVLMRSGESFDSKANRDEIDPELLDGFDAEVFLSDLDGTLQLCNFDHFYYLSQAERDDETLRARRYLLDGNDFGLETIARVRNYEQGLEIWKQILLRNKKLRNDTSLLDGLCESHLRYLYNFHRLPSGEGRRIKRALLVQDVVGLSLAAPAAGPECTLSLEQLSQLFKSETEEYPYPRIEGPLDAKDESGIPLMPQSVELAVSARYPVLAAGAGRPLPPVDKTAMPHGMPPGGPGRGRGGPPQRPQ